MQPLSVCDWQVMRGGNFDALGLIPCFVSPDDPRPAREQFHERYAHGGGWRPFEGFTLVSDCPTEEWRLQYPDDPPMRLVAYTRLRDEMICIFEYAWVAIVAVDGSYEIARMD